MKCSVEKFFEVRCKTESLKDVVVFAATRPAGDSKIEIVFYKSISYPLREVLNVFEVDCDNTVFNKIFLYSYSD